jgi:hypothetical protein
VTASLLRRSRSVARRWCRSALAAICVPANAGVDHVAAAGRRDDVGDVRAFRALRGTLAEQRDARAVTRAGLSGAIERALLDHAWNSSVAVDAVMTALVLAALSGPG